MLITEVAQGRALPDEVINQILVRTDGVPLFIEELTKAVLAVDSIPISDHKARSVHAKEIMCCLRAPQRRRLR
jgi:hypothetical protein